VTDTYAANGSDMYNGGTPEAMPQVELTGKKVQEAWDRSQRATQEERRTAALNQRFILNKHWNYWNQATGRLEELPRQPERVRATIARIGPDSNRLIAKMTQNDLSFEVMPDSPDDAAIQASKVAEAAVMETAREQSWEDYRYDHAFTTWIGGVGGMSVEWDQRTGTPIGVDQQGRTVATGDVLLTPLSIHEMAVEAGTRNAEKASWWIRGLALPPAEVQQHYNMETMPKADARAVDTVWTIAEGERSANTPLTMVLVYYERPQGQSQGRIATVVNGEIIEQTPWTFPFRDRLNLCTSIVQPIHGRWYGHTPVTDAVPIQTAMNASWSSIIEHMKQAGNARLWIPEGSVDNVADLSDLPGESTEYVPINGARPQYESPPAMPDWWIRQPGMLGDAMDDVLGQHDVSRGNAPTGVESGIALSILAENDDTPVGRFGKNLTEMWGRVGSLVLELYAQHVQDTRRATVQMPDSNIPQLIEWSGQTLKGHTTARVPTEAHSMRGRSAQAAWAMQLFDRGIITSPTELAKIADLPNQNDLLNATDPDTARAMRENAHLASGQARTVDVIDDHQNHIHHHRNFVRSQRYEQLPVEKQQLIRMHMTAHMMYAADQAAAQAMAASVSPIAAALPTDATSPIDEAGLQEATTLSALAPSAGTGPMGAGADMPPELLAMMGGEGAMPQGVAPEGEGMPMGEGMQPGMPTAPPQSPMGAQPLPEPQGDAPEG